MSRTNKTALQIRIRVIMFILALIILLNSEYLFAQDSVITVYCNKEIGQINKQVFGSSLEVAMPGKGLEHSYRRSDYGGGVWNPEEKKSVEEVVTLAINAGLSVIRFSAGKYLYWDNAIGNERDHFLFGIDEFLKTTEEIGAKAIFSVSYINADAQDAADLVEYLNAPSDGLYPWARERARNGHMSPYNVEYFEIGNEIYDPRFKVSPEEYAHKYLEYYEAMKRIDSSVKIGAVFGPSNWNRRVMEVIRDKIDFGIIHIYPTPLPTLSDKKVIELSSSEIFRLTLSIPVIKSEMKIQQILKLLREKAGKDIPLAITEFNIGLPQSEPINYRYTLGAALVNAELLRIFMKSENNILMANYHQFSSPWWGMFKSQYKYYKDHDYRRPVNYIKRPNYYIFELYNRHFGEILIDAEVKGEVYNVDRDESYMQKIISNINEGTISGGNLLGDQWKIKKLEGVNADEKNGELEIDFIDPKKFNYFHASKRAEVQPGTYYRLSGYIKTEDLIDRVGISLLIVDSRGWPLTHSIAETERILGTNNWQYVHIIYKTLKDAKSVKVIARRIGESGPLKGKVFLKDVRLEQIDPGTRIPYLSVNASKSKDGNTVYLMVINKNLDKAMTSLVDLKGFKQSKNVKDNSDGNALSAKVWVLNGPSIRATNESRTDNVKVLHKELRIESSSFEFSFEPHSVTAIEIERRR